MSVFVGAIRIVVTSASAMRIGSERVLIVGAVWKSNGGAHCGARL